METLLSIDETTDEEENRRWSSGLERWRNVDGDYMSYTSIANQFNSSGAEYRFDGGHEAWLTYRLWFAPDFDFGRNEKAHSVGGKLPGLAAKGPAASAALGHTGGNHDEWGWSGRLMWRGFRSDGRSYRPADAIGIGLYAYDLETAMGRQYGRQILFRTDGATTNPPHQSFDGTNNGTSIGRIGDTGVWLAPVGEWITFTLGYGYGHPGSDTAPDGDWFTAYASTESDPTSRLVLHMTSEIETDDRPRFAWANANAEKSIDSLLMQTYWGGATSAWTPKSETELRYANLRVTNSNPLRQPEPEADTPVAVSPSSRIAEVLAGVAPADRLGVICDAYGQLPEK